MTSNPFTSGSRLKKQMTYFALAAVLGSVAFHAILLLGGIIMERFFGPDEASRTVLLRTIVEPADKTLKNIDLDSRSLVDTLEKMRGEPLKFINILETTPDVEPPAGAVPTDIMPKQPEVIEAGMLPDIGGTTGEDDRRAILGTERVVGISGETKAGFIGSGTGVGSAVGNMGEGLGRLAGGSDILLVWLLDSSPSMRSKIDQLTQRIRPLFKSLNAGRKDRMLMTVIAFDSKPVRILEKPTDSPAEIIKAFREVKKRGIEKQKQAVLYYLKHKAVHPQAGVENVMKAVEFAANMSGETHRKVIIALMTDEAGNDSKRVEQAVSALKRHKAPLYVFGSSTKFTNNITTSRTKMSDPRFARAGSSNKSGSVIISASADRGWAMPHAEPLASNWGILLPGIPKDAPSGYGSYYLCKLVQNSGGTFYMLDDNVPYAGTEKMAGFSPLYSSSERRRIYSGFGKRLMLAVKRWDSRPKPPGQIGTNAAFDAATQTAASNLALTGSLIASIESLGASEASPRWSAHRELFLTELYAARYRLIEYLAVLKSVAQTNLGTHMEGRRKIKTTISIRNHSVASARSLAPPATLPFPTYKRLQLVIRNDKEWQKALEEHAAYRELQQKPAVDFSSQMLIIVSGGKCYSPNARMDIVSASQTKAGVIEVAVDRFLPSSSGLANYDKNYFPSSMIVVSKSDTEVKFLTIKQWLASKAEKIGKDLPGKTRAAEALLKARITLTRFKEKYSGTPWGNIAGHITLLSFRASVGRQDITPPPRPPRPPGPSGGGSTPRPPGTPGGGSAPQPSKPPAKPAPRPTVIPGGA